MSKPIDVLEFAAQQCKNKASVYGLCMSTSQLSSKHMDALFTNLKPSFEIIEKHMDEGTLKADGCGFWLEDHNRLEFMINAKDDSVQSIALGTFREVSRMLTYGSMGFQTVEGRDSKPIYVIEFLNVPARATREDALTALVTELIRQIDTQSN